MAEQNRSGAYTQFVYSPTGFEMQIMNGQSSIKSIVALPAGNAVVYTAAGQFNYYSDHLGSFRFASTTSRTMYFDLAYAPFGETYATSGSTDPAFTGQRQDTVSGLYDFPAREYSIQGRWPSPDPAGLAAVDPTNPQSWNRYAYVRNNPLSRIDPTGMNDCPDNKATCGDDWTDPFSGSPGVDLFGGLNLFPDEGANPDPWDGRTFNGFCISTDGIIAGNNIFDAITGTPGTFLTLNMRGQQGFGFSENLWSMTQNFLDANPFLRGSSGLQVMVQNFGVGQVTSGLVPEYVALMQQQSSVLAQLPGRFAQDMAVEQDALVAAGMNPGAAAIQALQYEVNLMQNYYSTEPDAANWLGTWQNLNLGLVAWANRWSPVFPH